MAHMPDFVEDLLEEGFRTHMPHFRHDQAQPAPAVTVTAPISPPNAAIALNQEVTPMSILADIKAAVENAGKLVEAVAGNPLVDAIAEAGLGFVLNPAEVAAVAAFIQQLESARKAEPAPDVPPLPQDVPPSAAAPAQG